MLLLLLEEHYRLKTVNTDVVEPRPKRTIKVQRVEPRAVEAVEVDDLVSQLGQLDSRLETAVGDLISGLEKLPDVKKDIQRLDKAAEKIQRVGIPKASEVVDRALRTVEKTKKTKKAAPDGGRTFAEQVVAWKQNQGA
jgi:hypothetical protein